MLSTENPTDTQPGFEPGTFRLSSSCSNQTGYYVISVGPYLSELLSIPLDYRLTCIVGTHREILQLIFVLSYGKRDVFYGLSSDTSKLKKVYPRVQQFLWV